MADLRNILSQDEGHLSEQDLLNYLRNNHSPQDQRKIEEALADSGFENDAIEGLQLLNDPVLVQEHVKQLNRSLHKQLHGKKDRRRFKELKLFHWIILALLLLLFICIVGYAVIRLQTAHP